MEPFNDRMSVAAFDDAVQQKETTEREAIVIKLLSEFN